MALGDTCIAILGEDKNGSTTSTRAFLGYGSRSLNQPHSRYPNKLPENKLLYFN